MKMGHIKRSRTFEKQVEGLIEIVLFTDTDVFENPWTTANISNALSRFYEYSVYYKEMHDLFMIDMCKRLCSISRGLTRGIIFVSHRATVLKQIQEVRCIYEQERKRK